jgi:hypothetical protein
MLKQNYTNNTGHTLHIMNNVCGFVNLVRSVALGHAAMLSLYEQIKTQWFCSLFPFQTVPRSPSQSRPTILERYLPFAIMPLW